MADNNTPAEPGPDKKKTAPQKNVPEAKPATKEAAKPKPHARHGARTRPARWPGYLALLLILGLAAAGYYYWQQFNRTLADLDQRLEQQSGTASQQAQQLTHLQTGTTQQQLQVQQQLQQLQRGGSELHDAVVELRTRLGSGTRQWSLAEAEYLMRIANYRVLLDDDKQAARYALQEADTILRQLLDPGLQAVREQLAREIAALEAAELPDTAGMSAELSALSRRVSDLPLLARERGLDSTTGAAQSATAQSQWQQVLSDLWRELKALVVIRRNEKAIAPLMPPEQERYLYLNLQHQLESARLAMLKGEPSLWRDSLQSAQEWIAAHFDVEAQDTRAALDSLSQLQQREILAELPDISASLRMLDEFRQRQVLESPPPAAPVPDAAVEQPTGPVS